MMFTGRSKVAAVGVFVATVSVLGLCFAAVWAGDYHQLNESKSAEISQPYNAQPAIHPQLDENEEVSMRKTILDLRGAIPEAVVKLNVVLDNVVLPTDIQQLTNSGKPECPGGSLAACKDEWACKDDDECNDQCGKRCGGPPPQMHTGSRISVHEPSASGFVLKVSKLGPPMIHPGVHGRGKLFIRGIFCVSAVAAVLHSSSVLIVFSGAQEVPLKITAAATGGKKLDKAHRICLNTQLNELDATYQTSLVDYKTKKGPDFVVGPVTPFTTASANADADQSLADADFLKVAGMGFLPSSHLLHTAHPGSCMDTSPTT
jgi:hypothetical protein